jgi:acetate kinase
LDPGTLIYLLESGGFDLESLTQLIERESGLLGVSGRTADVKQLLDQPDDPASAQALGLFCRGVCKQIGAYAALLGGLDTLVFTGGIGENSAWVRDQVCRSLGFLGVRLEREANARNAELIGAAGSGCVVRVVKTDEACMIARHTRGVVCGA